jgi:hypothetical protein
MKLFKCQNCGNAVYFENRTCESCGCRLGYLPDLATISALKPDGDLWLALAAQPEDRYRFCANAEFDACNWLVPAAAEGALCIACRHNRTIPDVSDDENLTRWRKFELAKHRLFYSLLRLGLPLADRSEDPAEGLAFDFLEEGPDAPKVLTGHENGLITLNLKEADDVEREKSRTAMAERYRTLLGHFRHEVGHYFWDRLVRDGGKLDAFRDLFGDERQDYGQALQAHYSNGPPPDWQEHFISAYASSHPWEDFAETWAHYLHMADTLETAYAFGLRVRPAIDETSDLSADLDFDPYDADVDHLIRAWLPLTFAVNALNRSMGEPDLYPFILSPPAITKLEFVHRLIRGEADPIPKAAAA